MTPETSISIALIISLVSIICTVINTFGSDSERRKNSERIDQEDRLGIEKNFVKINVKLDSFMDTTNSIARGQEKSNEALQDLNAKMIQANDRIETLYHYNDDHEQRIKHLEGIDTGNERQSKPL